MAASSHIFPESILIQDIPTQIDLIYMNRAQGSPYGNQHYRIEYKSVSHRRP